MKGHYAMAGSLSSKCLHTDYNERKRKQLLIPFQSFAPNLFGFSAEKA